MAETIETFVAKLQAEGVQAGKQAAEKLLAEARQQAQDILRQAREQAKKIVDDAASEAARLAEKSGTELTLAARDIVLALRDRLAKALQEVLAAGVRRALSDADFLGALVRDVVLQYAKADSQGAQVRVNVSDEMRRKLAEWSLAALAGGQGQAVDLRAELKEAGFEYQARGATVEVTAGSVVEMLNELVAPELRELLRKAVGEPSEERKH